MLEKFIKKDKNEELEKILESKEIEEQAENLLQGIMYKLEDSYKDYKKVKGSQIAKSEYIGGILKNIKNNCDDIQLVNLSQNMEDKKVQKELEKNKYCIRENRIISYPIETKLLYAIEKVSNNQKFINRRYGVVADALSNTINIGQCINDVEPLRDFNGWSWTTVNEEIEDIKANIVYQTLQMMLGEKFLKEWSQDKDGIIDYILRIKENLFKEYGEELSGRFIELLYGMAIIVECENNKDYKKLIKNRLEEITENLATFENKASYTEKYTNKKKEATKEISKINILLSQESKLKEEYDKRNAGVELKKKIFSVKVFRKQLEDRKKYLLNVIQECNYYLNPENYLYEKNQVEKQEKILATVNYNVSLKKSLIVDFEHVFLKCFKKSLEKIESDELIKKMYQFRYFMFIPFDNKKCMKDVKELSEEIQEIEKKLIDLAIDKKVINSIPDELIDSIFQTRIMSLEDLFYKVEKEKDRYYIQLFDENISENRFEIEPTKKIKTNKKVKIFN